MNREKLVAEARICAEAASHNLRLIRKHPEKVLPGEMIHVEGQLLQLMEFARWEKRNARRAGRALLVKRMKLLVSPIIALLPPRSKSNESAS
ncbi:hypothetical protein PA598K_01373 [Paenibacillus sp. 598K]|uniref:hypothetical protein n=1 Tax=Paenibacillus sp. 598K TaxID=1117987 RepID=UPI000FF95B27|nr:hypothetical protein [Paenibacillus sp. 598K]GBF73088.1 hypothetical protein PA598K_01373 [Paenibacillus sp. 598K]